MAGVAVFVTVARAGSFTLAAERLGLTKSAVGKIVTKLEERLGFRLFHRTTRLMRLTADGEAYLATCAAAIDDVTATQLALSSDTKTLSGRISMDMPVVFGREVVLPLLLETARAHPHLAFSLTFSDATTDLLREDVDLAVRFGTLKDTSHLIARHLATQSRVICASPDYLRGNGVPQGIDDLGSHRCIMGAPKGPPLAWFITEDGAERRILPTAAHQISDGQAMVEAAVGGLGLIQVPISMVRKHLIRDELVAVMHDLSASVEIHAVWPRKGQLNPRIRYLVDQLVGHATKGMLD
jgi:DNA-binding transcriptional LysR family regulator